MHFAVICLNIAIIFTNCEQFCLMQISICFVKSLFADEIYVYVRNWWTTPIVDHNIKALRLENQWPTFPHAFHGSMCCIWIWNIIDDCFGESSWQYVSNGLGNDLNQVWLIYARVIHNWSWLFNGYCWSIVWLFNRVLCTLDIALLCLYHILTTDTLQLTIESNDMGMAWVYVQCQNFAIVMLHILPHYTKLCHSARLRISLESVSPKYCKIRINIRTCELFVAHLLFSLVGNSKVCGHRICGSFVFSLNQ